MSVSIIVPCYNNVDTVERALLSIEECSQEVPLSEVVVICSGCNDGTVEAVYRFTKEKEGWVVIVEKERGGKTRAVIRALKECNGDIVFVIGGDNVVIPGSLGIVYGRFKDNRVGGVGVRNLAMNEPTWAGYMGDTLWKVHHKACVSFPKLGGDFIAFRKDVVKDVRVNCVDDASIEVAILRAGMRVVYEGRAGVIMYPPKNVKGLLNQRSRIHSGYQQLGYKPKTTSVLWAVEVLKVGISSLGLLVVEGLGRVKGKIRKVSEKWEKVS